VVPVMPSSAHRIRPGLRSGKSKWRVAEGLRAALFLRGAPAPVVPESEDCHSTSDALSTLIPEHQHWRHASRWLEDARPLAEEVAFGLDRAVLLLTAAVAAPRVLRLWKFTDDNVISTRGRRCSGNGAVPIGQQTNGQEPF